MLARHLPRLARLWQCEKKGRFALHWTELIVGKKFWPQRLPHNQKDEWKWCVASSKWGPLHVASTTSTATPDSACTAFCTAKAVKTGALNHYVTAIRSPLLLFLRLASRKKLYTIFPADPSPRISAIMSFDFFKTWQQPARELQRRLNKAAEDCKN